MVRAASAKPRSSSSTANTAGATSIRPRANIAPNCATTAAKFSSAIERYLNGNFEAYIGNWSGRADPDPTLIAFFSCAGSQNVNKYCNKDLDTILLQGRTETDEAKRKALYAKATDIYLSALPSIPLYHPNWFFAARKSVGGIVMVPDGLLRLTGVKPVN